MDDREDKEEAEDMLDTLMAELNPLDEDEELEELKKVATDVHLIEAARSADEDSVAQFDFIDRQSQVIIVRA